MKDCSILGTDPFTANNSLTSVDFLGLQLIKGNSFGDWEFTQVNGINKNDQTYTKYESQATIQFTNKSTCDCEEVAFIQVYRYVYLNTDSSLVTDERAKGRATPNGWAVDALYDHKYGWYGYKNDGKLYKGNTSGNSSGQWAIMSDTPGWGQPSTSWRFESCATCKKGNKQGVVFACLNWGFDTVVYSLSSITPSHSDAPSQNWKDAVAAWNTQAKGPKEKRNHSDQVTLDIP